MEVDLNAFELRIQQDCSQEMFNDELRILQINLGFKCNLSCTHCHLECGPNRLEMMDWDIMDQVIHAAALLRPEKVDITGGAPELHPFLQRFISGLKNNDHKVQMRTNLTALLETGLEDMPQFLKENQVHLVASLPCYLEENVREQRGKDAYETSIFMLQTLNELGYGQKSELPLSLVYNPRGPFLPPAQNELEEEYRKELLDRFSIQFTNLLTITNMPIGRFWENLKTQEKHSCYMQLLTHGFNCHTVPDLMCRHQICVAWDGILYDCDFNLALSLPVYGKKQIHVQEFEVELLKGRKIRTGNHCFGCTAGFGSSCGGALVRE